MYIEPRQFGINMCTEPYQYRQLVPAPVQCQWRDAAAAAAAVAIARAGPYFKGHSLLFIVARYLSPKYTASTTTHHAPSGMLEPGISLF